MTLDDAPEALTVPQVGELLQLSRNTIYAMVRDGTLPHVRLRGHMIRVPKRALKNYLDLAATPR